MVKIYKNKLATFEKQICKKYGSERDSKTCNQKYKNKTEEENKIDISRMGKEKNQIWNQKNGEQDCLMEFQDLQYDNFYKGLFGKRRPIITQKVIKEMQGYFK